MEHATGSMNYFTARAHGEEAQMGPVKTSGRDDAVQQLAAGMSAAAQAWHTPGAIERKIQAPFGEVDGQFMAGITLTEIVMHGWDLAKATGQQLRVPDEIAEMMLERAKQTMKPEMRGKAFGPEVSVPDSTPVLDRLAAFLGRQP
jgi:uncharacterized protein (TIGR03086 family)